jgi:hypothetical protein
MTIIISTWFCLLGVYNLNLFHLLLCRIYALVMHYREDIYLCFHAWFPLVLLDDGSDEPKHVG